MKTGRLSAAAFVLTLAVAARPAAAADKLPDVKALKVGCDGGRAADCTQLGRLRREGKGIEKDVADSVKLFRRGCDGGDASGCLRLGYSELAGDTGSPDAAGAARHFQAACDGRAAAGCGELAHLYSKGSGVGKDLAKALSVALKGCDQADKESCTFAGAAYVQGSGTPVDPAKGAPFLQKACNLGAGHACGMLALLYRQGRGVAQNVARAFVLDKQGCLKGDQKACERADQYEAGLVARSQPSSEPIENAQDARQDSTDGGEDSKEFVGVDDLREMCDRGDQASMCSMVGQAYEDGELVKKDLKQARLYYQKGCDQGDADACESAKRLEE